MYSTATYNLDGGHYTLSPHVKHVKHAEGATASVASSLSSSENKAEVLLYPIPNELIENKPTPTLETIA